MIKIHRVNNRNYTGEIKRESLNWCLTLIFIPNPRAHLNTARSFLTIKLIAYLVEFNRFIPKTATKK